MTLAEVFLLLMFIAWYGVASVSSGSGSIRELQILVEKLSSDLKEAKQAADGASQLRETNKFLKEILDAVGQQLGVPTPTSVDDALAKLRAHDKYVEQVARRGSPPCVTQNTLGRARMISGDPEFLMIQKFESSGLVFEAGETLQERRLSELFTAVAKYYEQRRAKHTECRFDYRLEWVTDGDYRAGREQFEQPYFYPSGIKHVPAGF